MPLTWGWAKSPKLLSRLGSLPRHGSFHV